MGWASTHIAHLQRGDTVKFRPHGKSMSGKIESGQLCTVAPANFDDLKVGDIVLCKVNGNQFLHLVTALRKDQAQISNNHGYINGWASRNSIYGKCVRVEN